MSGEDTEDEKKLSVREGLAEVRTTTKMLLDEFRQEREERRRMDRAQDEAVEKLGDRLSIVEKWQFRLGPAVVFVFAMLAWFGEEIKRRLGIK